MKPLESDAPLIVYVDVKSPYAFVAIRPILALEKELGLTFDWRPLTLDIPSYLGSAEKKKGKVVASEGRSQKTWNAIRYSYRDARRYAERQGLVLKGTEKIWDSSIANIGIMWVTQTARNRLENYLEAVYTPFWRRELDIEDVSVVESCLETAGVASDGFAEYALGGGRAAHDALQAQFHPAGIYGVPTFVIDGEILFGREHIPWIRWKLSGSAGNAPDIAYEITPC
ncbi:2-hydroxychromene-2-carboxylate isomerase [Parasphingorhabdus marina DSM 22363]|uniref:2-hydroxychromene-2-carboxylate isomerase n=1 Tax=Parasphingorhabdus marina DSM 22363 TaxID=1123272 RepID=A0A1N6HSN6_9SPHN|nr:DsbA family protein [Parasphingorhabdus marina]SIO22781.1 2-hydroxychromene-2-carboxylate isomerase [Parasphingorhabdus marina DSM 22363]